MPTPNERKGLWFLALVAVSGTGVRVWRSHAPGPPAAEARALERQVGRVDSARAARKEKRDRPKAKAKPARDTTPPGPVDLDNADVAAIDRLPGIGPAMAERLRPLVTFGGAPSPVSDACGEASKRPGKTRAARSRERS